MGRRTSNEARDKLKAELAQVILTEKPNVRWEDVAGLEEAKMILNEAVIAPKEFPQFFETGARPWAGILLYGVFHISTHSRRGRGRVIWRRRVRRRRTARFFL
jgi:ATP-dependent 26S proteasome regulatory subunit